jgi:hypothetical protein
MDTLNQIGCVLLVICLWVLLQIAIDSKNPCSNFSPNPEMCGWGA